MTHKSKFFYGHEISNYGLENGYVDYRTLSRAFDAVINNDIMGTMEGLGFYFELESGMNDFSDEIEEVENKILYTEDEAELEELEAELDDLRDRDGILEDEIFQYFIVSDNGAKILKEANEVVFYCKALDMYIWGVCHWGTSWDYVLTNIKLEIEESED